MARILICEPHADIRSLLAFVVRRLGHEPVISDGSREQVVAADAIVLEPGQQEALELARWARQEVPTVAIVCASIFPPWPETVALEPDAFLVKPFPLFKLEHALSSALEQRAGPHAVDASSVTA